MSTPQEDLHNISPWLLLVCTGADVSILLWGNAPMPFFSLVFWGWQLIPGWVTDAVKTYRHWTGALTESDRAK